MATIKQLIESQANAANINTSALDLYKIVNAAVKEGGPVALYDSAGVMPIDSDYVGSLLSTSTGELYILDSAGGSWNILNGSALYYRPAIPGTNYGYFAGGNVAAQVTEINKFPFANDTNITLASGVLSIAAASAATSSSLTSGYISGGYSVTSPTSPIPINYPTAIQKYSFATDANTTVIGAELDVGTRYSSSHVMNGSYGYTSGTSTFGGTPPLDTNLIWKFPFISENKVNIAGRSIGLKYSPGGHSSETHGYHSGGSIPTSTPTYTNVIDRFPFAADGDATDVGDLTLARAFTASQSSSTHGYLSGGQSGPTDVYSVTIDKFAFASSANATDVGDLSLGRKITAGASSTDYGYIANGQKAPPAPSYTNSIEKFSFASDGNASSVGSTTTAKDGSNGLQY